MLRTIRSILVFLTLVFCLLATPSGNAQTREAEQPPSLETTLAWIREKLPIDGGWVEEDDSARMNLVEFQGCVMSYRVTQGDTGGLVRGVEMISIPLAEIDPEATKVIFSRGHYQCLLKTASAGKKIKFSGSVTVAGRRTAAPDSLVSEHELPFSDQAMAERFKKAFSNAASHCRARKEPF